MTTENQPQEFADVAWRIEDITMKFGCSEEKAKEFLENNADHIQHAMIEAGWKAIEVCGDMDEMWTDCVNDSVCEKCSKGCDYDSEVCLCPDCE